MALIPDHLRLPTHPHANPDAIVATDHWRITVLTDRLLRLEWSDTGVFEDRATQTVLNRNFPVPDFRVRRTPDGGIQLDTGRVRLHYDGQRFSPEGMWAEMYGGPRIGNGAGVPWRYGIERHSIHFLRGNLGGTARTLDEVDGSTTLDPGIMDAQSFTTLDDSHSLALSDDGWVAPPIDGNIDFYLFGYPRDYLGALDAYYRLTGPQPLLPRFALGNWWSRYHAYTDQEYRDLMNRFAMEGIPFSVAVLDMDWHLVDVDTQYGAGWTGYTWNRELFPNPAGFLGWLHDRGLRTSLNIHPADGVRPFEDAYPRLARALGRDPQDGESIEFDIADPEFVIAFLNEVLHPLEDDGVDLWWIDWQQGTYTKIPGLDPLWMLNHFLYLDSGRRGWRPLTFSRYAGPGSHRYPVGFSGDTIISWASLDFQPYFTATASNIGYGWWSHDIGGHMFGVKDDELTARWVQLGCFSPINRLHSNANEFAGKEPWRYNPVARDVMTTFLRLRERLAPYLMTMNERAHAEGRPLIEPLYYTDPMADDAYRSPNSFWFGSQLLVAAITTPADAQTHLGAVTGWLPPGDWFDMFTGWHYRGDRQVRLHRPLVEYPVLARAGAIVPLAGKEIPAWQNPAAIELHVWVGADGELTLYEDDDRLQPRTLRTPIQWNQESGTLLIGPAEGDAEVVPEPREWTVIFHGLDANQASGVDAEFESDYDPVAHQLTVVLGQLDADSAATVKLTASPTIARNDLIRRAYWLIDQAEMNYDVKQNSYLALAQETTLARRMARLEALNLPDALLDALSELLLADA